MDPKDCLFCKIAKGEIPSKKVYEDSHTIAFLDINPASPGHTLVVPKRHAEDITKSDSADLANAMEVVKRVASKMKENLHVAGVNVIQNNGHIAGQLVAHLHFHVIPRYPNDNVVIHYQRANVPDADMEEIRKKLSDSPPVKGDFDLDF